MSLRTILVVALALVTGVSAAWAIKTVGIGQLPATAPKPETVTVVVTAAEVPRGTSLSADVLTTREWPRKLVPEGAIRKVEDALDRVAYGQLVKGECVLEGKLAPYSFTDRTKCPFPISCVSRGWAPPTGVRS